MPRDPIIFSPEIDLARKRDIIPVDKLQVSACPHPFKADRLDYIVPVGSTIQQIIDIVQLDPVLKEHGLVFLNDIQINKDIWHRVKPKHGAIVSIKMLPRSGGGFLRVFAMVAVTALAITAAPFLGPFGAAGISIFGGLLVNYLLPPPTPKMSKNYGNESQTYAISGQRNSSTPWGKVPFLAGRHKITPPYGATPYREVVGSEIYWRALFVIGHGPIFLHQWYLGQTHLDNFQNIEIEQKRGYWSYNHRGNWDIGSGSYPSNPQFGDMWTLVGSATIQGRRHVAGESITYNGIYGAGNQASWDSNQERPFSLFPSDAHEDGISVAIKYGNPQVRTSQASADEIGIELIFERGLVHLQNSPPGKRSDKHMTILIQQSPTGANNWTNVTIQTITGRQTSPLYWGHRWRTTDFGAQSPIRQYDVRVYNMTGDMDEDRNFGNFSWFSLKSFTMQNPVPFTGVAMVAMRIKATGQLSGVIDEFNVIAETMAREYVPYLNSWEWRITSSPPALFRHILQHPLRWRPATDSQIDLEKLAYWQTILAGKNRNFNGVFDTKGLLADALNEICRIGRAVLSLRELRYSVIIDEPKTTPVRMFTPLNSWDYSGEMTHEKMPDAYRVGYIDRDKDYSAQEVIVYDDAYGPGSAVNIELIQWVGIDNRDQAWREGRFHLAQRRLRRETHKISTDFEHLCCNRGDLVALQYDTISVGGESTRVIRAIESGALVLSVELDAAVTMEQGKRYNLRVRRVVNNQQTTDSFEVYVIAGQQKTVSFINPPSIINAPKAGDLAAFGELNRETIRVIVRDIEPKSDLSAVLTLISEAPGIHVAEYGAIPPYDAGVTRPRTLPAPLVLSVSSDARVMMVTASRALIDRVVFALQPPSIEGIYTRVSYRLTGTAGAWQVAAIQDETAGTVAVIGPEAGEAYDFRLQYLHPGYLGSPITSINSYFVIGRTGLPNDLVNLTLGIIGGQALLRWDLPVDLDVQVGGWIMFRHSPNMETAMWPNTTSIAQAVVGDQTHVFLPLKAGTYFGKVYDADGRASSGATSISTKQASILAFSPVGSIQEDPTFAGAKTNVFIFEDGLMLNTGDFDSIENVDLAESWDIAGGVFAAGLYKFASGIDLGSITRARVTSNFVVESVNQLDYIDSKEGNIDEWPDIDGTTEAVCDAMVYGKFTDNDPNADPTWTSFVRIDSLEMQHRALGQLECRMYTGDPSFNVWVRQLRIVAEQVV